VGLRVDLRRLEMMADRSVVPWFSHHAVSPLSSAFVEWTKRQALGPLVQSAHIVLLGLPPKEQIQ
jgi:hypothetical protein